MRRPQPTPRRILLITLDTTRADRLGCYGFSVDGVSPTPAIDRLAAESVVAAYAVTSVPLTLPAHASILTGLEPPQHTIRENDGFRLPSRRGRAFSTLAERLGDSGWRTAAFVSTQVLDGEFGLDAGFATYDDVGRQAAGGELMLSERNAAATTDAALAWLDANEAASSFVWVHYFDPHEPHVRHGGTPGDIASRALSDYVGEIAFMDIHVGRLLERYRNHPDWSETLVVVVGDHGESLGEHGEPTHGYLVHDSTMRVPLMVKPPQSASVAVRNLDWGRIIDVTPTILELAGLAPEGLTGESLLNAAGAEMSAYGESVYPFRQFDWAALWSLRSGAWKLIDDGRSPALFDMMADPDELRDVAAEHPDVVARLSRDLTELRGRLEPRVDQDSRLRESRDLVANSYFGGPSSDVPFEPTRDESAKRPAPRQRLEVVRALDGLRTLLERLDVRGESDVDLAAIVETVALLDRLDPAGPMTLFWTGRALLKAGSRSESMSAERRIATLEDSVARFDRLLSVRRLDYRAMNQISSALLEGHGRTADPAWLTRLLERSRQQEGAGLADGLAFALRAKALDALGQTAEAISAFERAVALAPDRQAFRRDLEELRGRP